MPAPTGILLSHRKDEITQFSAAWMDLEIIILNEVNQSQVSHGIT